MRSATRVVDVFSALDIRIRDDGFALPGETSRSLGSGPTGATKSGQLGRSASSVVTLGDTPIAVETE